MLVAFRMTTRKSLILPLRTWTKGCRVRSQIGSTTRDPTHAIVTIRHPRYLRVIILRHRLFPFFFSSLEICGWVRSTRNFTHLVFVIYILSRSGGFFFHIRYFGSQVRDRYEGQSWGRLLSSPLPRFCAAHYNAKSRVGLIPPHPCFSLL